MMKNRELTGLLLFTLLAPPMFAGISPSTVTQQNNETDAIAELAVSANERQAVRCSNFVQNCTINIGLTSCVNPPGSITVTNNSIINARNISASSANVNFLSYVLQNNGCPAILGPKASCSISFTSTTSTAFLVPNVMVKGSNTNATYFDINALPCATGALAPIPGSPFNAQLFPSDLAATPNSQFLYVSSSSSDSVIGYSINQTTGVLTPVSGSPFPAGNSPSGVAVSPNGQFVYVSNFSDNTLSAYQINQSTGNLTSIAGSPFSSGSGPTEIAITPNGNFLYVSNQNGNTVSAYAINSGTGALTQIPGSPFSSPIPTGITITPNGAFLYVANRASFGFGYVYGFSINPTTGFLTAIPGSPFQTGTFPDSVVSNSLGTFIYVAANNGPGFKINDYDNSIWIYSVDQSTGTLTNVTPVPPMSMVAASDIALTPNNKYAYTTHYSENTVLGDLVDATTGALILMSSNPYATGDGPDAIIVTPNGLFVYVVNYNGGSISGYAIH